MEEKKRESSVELAGERDLRVAREPGGDQAAEEDAEQAQERVRGTVAEGGGGKFENLNHRQNKTPAKRAKRNSVRSEDDVEEEEEEEEEEDDDEEEKKKVRR